jgi:RNA polymerase sigma-70 factor (ECF subfamily)
LNLTVQDILFLQHRVAYTRDEHAYKRLFFHFHPPLFRFAYNIVQDTDLAEEIVSDVMMKLWDLGSRLAQVDKLNAYLFTAIKNTALTRLSSNKLQQVALDEWMENTVSDKTDTPETRLLLAETEQRIEAAVTSLPRQCQLVYRLIKEEGFSYKQVAVILEISQNTIETHMRIALKKIRLALDHYLAAKK